MKLKSPELIIPDENPYFNDTLNRKVYGDSLYNLFQKFEDNNVVCLDAPWGEGKSSFIKMWLAEIKKKNINCIYYDAYSNDYNDDPFISFTSEIISLAETHFSDTSLIQDYKSEFKNKAVNIAKNILISGTKIGIKALTAGLINYSDIETLKDIKDGVTDEADNLLSKYAEQKITSYKDEKQTIIKFKVLLSDLGNEIRVKQNFPLLIIIDELDRCRPDFSLLLLERIKHLFSVDNVSFLILTNLTQLKNYVETIYGTKIDAHNYLHKFFTISTTFPTKSDNTYNEYHQLFFEKLCRHHGIIKINELGFTALPLFRHLNFSLREIERQCSILALYYANIAQSNTSIPEIVSLVSIIKVRFPELFYGLINNTLTFDKLNGSLKLNSIITNEYRSFDKSWLIKILKFFLYTDEEFNELSKEDEIKSFLSFYNTVSRKLVLPKIANNMERYNIS